jgi:hypothetical protein
MFLSLDIPANTKESAPTQKNYVIGRATIRALKVNIPDGHAYLTHLEILTRGRPLFNKGDRYITGNGNEILFNDSMVLDGPPYEITLSGWNEDDTYSHAFYVEVN